VLIVPVLLVLLFAVAKRWKLRPHPQSDQYWRAHRASNMAEAIRRHLPQSMQDLEFVGPLQQGMEKIASYLAGSLAGMVKTSSPFLVDLFILLFALFFMSATAKAFFAPPALDSFLKKAIQMNESANHAT